MNTETREKWRGKPLGARLAHCARIYVKHAAVKRVLDYVERELPFREAEGKSAGLLVIAPSGAGKSSLIEYLRRTYPDKETETLTLRRVVSFKVPPSPSPSSLGTELLKALGDPLPDQGNAKKKLDRIEELLKKVGTFIVCIDDFQDVPASRRTRGMKVIADWIRDLCEMHFPGIVIALGTDEAAVVRDAHPQLLRRMQARIELPVFAFASNKQKGEFIRLLTLIDTALPMAEESNLGHAEIAVRLHRATAGNLDYLMKLLAKALSFTIARGSERIELADFEAAFDAQHQVAAEKGNPFAIDYDGEELTGPGQIFYRKDLPAEGEHGGRTPTSKGASAA